MDILDLTIEDTLMSIFKRQYFFVYADESVYMAAVCLIPSIEVYLDGVIVIDDNKVIGRIGSKDILKGYSRFGIDVFNYKIEEIMYRNEDNLKVDSSIRDIIDDIIKNGVGFAPIINNGVIAIVSIYDILKVILKLELNIPLIGLGSKIITIDSNTSIEDALDIMIKNNIRRLFIKDDIYYTITDRIILNFIIENSINTIDVSNTPLNQLKIKAITLDVNKCIKDVILALLKNPPPSSVIVNENVITPMDIIKCVIRYK